MPPCVKPAPVSMPVTRSVTGGFVLKSTDGFSGKRYPNSPMFASVYRRFDHTRCHLPLYIQLGLTCANVECGPRVADSPRSGLCFLSHW